MDSGLFKTISRGVLQSRSILQAAKYAVVDGLWRVIKLNVEKEAFWCRFLRFGYRSSLLCLEMSSHLSLSTTQPSVEHSAYEAVGKSKCLKENNLISVRIFLSPKSLYWSETLAGSQSRPLKLAFTDSDPVG